MSPRVMLHLEIVRFLLKLLWQAEMGSVRRCGGLVQCKGQDMGKSNSAPSEWWHRSRSRRHSATTYNGHNSSSVSVNVQSMAVQRLFGRIARQHWRSKATRSTLASERIYQCLYSASLLSHWATRQKMLKGLPGRTTHNRTKKKLRTVRR